MAADHEQADDDQQVVVERFASFGGGGDGDDADSVLGEAFFGGCQRRWCFVACDPLHDLRQDGSRSVLL
jgi:hypothetical protein